MHSKIRLTSGRILAALMAVAVGACVSQSDAALRHELRKAAVRGLGAPVSAVAAVRRESSVLVVRGPGQLRPTWRMVASVGGQAAAWIAQRSGVTLLRFDQRFLHVALHAGSGEPAGRGWAYGDHIVLARFTESWQPSMGASS